MKRSWILVFAAAAGGCLREDWKPLPGPQPRPAGGTPVQARSGGAPGEDPALPVGKSTLSLPDCLRLSQAQSERVESLAAEIRLYRAQARQALSTALPRVSANALYSRQEAGAGVYSLKERTEDWLRLEQALFSGFRDVHAKRAADLLVASASASRENELAEVRLATCEAYAQVLSAHQQGTAVGSSLELARNRLRELEARRDAGLARRTEVLLAEAQVARQEALATEVDGQEKVARAVLSFAIGRPADLPLEVFPGLEIPPLDPGALTREALGRRRDLAALERAERAAERAVDAERAGWWPTLNFTGNWYDKREGISKDVDWDAGLSAQWAFFEGWKTGALVDQAEARHDQKRLAVQEKRRQILREAQETVSAYQTAHAVLASLRKEVAAASETEKLLAEECRQGIATQLELLTAQDTLLAARVNLARQELEERLAALRLWKVAGRFPDWVGTQEGAK